MTTQEQRRQAIGTAMVDLRTGRSVVDAIDRLSKAPTPRKSLPTLDPRGGVAAQRGVAPWVDSRPSSSGGGVAWPLTEQLFGQREYWEGGQASSDGLFFFPAIKKLVLTDADGREGVINLAQPEPPAP